MIQLLEWWIQKCHPKKTKGIGGFVKLGSQSSAYYARATAAASWRNTKFKGKTFIGNQQPQTGKISATTRNLGSKARKLGHKIRELRSQAKHFRPIIRNL